MLAAYTYKCTLCLFELFFFFFAGFKLLKDEPWTFLLVMYH